MITSDTISMTKSDIHKIGDLIKITARKCSDKVQPKIKVGQLFKILGIRNLKSGATGLSVQLSGTKRKYKINSDSFSWVVTTIGEIQKETFKVMMENDEKRLNMVLTPDEKGMMAVTPLIIYQLAWEYAMDVVRMCADNKISLLRDTTREIRKLRDEYYYFVKHDLDFAHQQRVIDKTIELQKTFNCDLTLMYYTISNIWLKYHPDWPYTRIRVTAIMVQIIISICDVHNHYMDILLKEKLGGYRQSKRIPIMEKLSNLMDVIHGESNKMRFKDYNLDNAIRVVSKKILSIEYTFNEVQ